MCKYKCELYIFFFNYYEKTFLQVVPKHHRGIMIKIMFVCHGNICRSPMAEFIMKEKVKNSRKKQYFLVTKGYEKFSDFSDLRFFDDQKLYEWFSLNKEEIFSSDYSIDINIKNQYYQYCYFVELEEIFLKADDEKFDEYGNRRFPSGALMYDWFISNLNYIKNSGEEIDKEIMLQYNNYLDKNNMILI